MIAPFSCFVKSARPGEGGRGKNSPRAVAIGAGLRYNEGAMARRGADARAAGKSIPCAFGDKEADGAAMEARKKTISVGRAAWRACKAHGGALAGQALLQVLLRALALAPLFLLPLLQKEGAPLLPDWASYAATGCIYALAVIPLRFFAGERLRFYSAPNLPFPRGGRPYAAWLKAGLMRYARGILWGLPFLGAIGYLVIGQKTLPFNTMWQPVQALGRLIGEASLKNGLPVAGALMVLLGLLFAYGWWRDLPMEYLPARHLGARKTLWHAKAARKRGRKTLMKNAGANALLSLPALIGWGAVLVPYVTENVRFSGNPQIMIAGFTRLLKAPLPAERVYGLLAVFIVLYLPLCILRKMRNAVAVRRLTRELNGGGRGRAAG